MKKFFTLLTLSLVFSSVSVFAQSYEADLSLLTGGATIENDVDATGGKCVYTRDGEVTFTIDIPQAGFYNIYSSAKTAGYKENYFQIDNGTTFVVNFDAGSSFNKRLIKGQLFTAGSHTIKLSKSWGYVYLDNIQVQLFTGQIYEAENANFGTNDGNVASIVAESDASSNNCLYTKGSNIVFNVSITEAGRYDVSAYIKSDNSSIKQNYFKIDDSANANFDIAFPVSKVFQIIEVIKNFQFSTGTHKIEMIKNWGWSYLDCISVSKNTDTATLLSNQILNTIVKVNGKMIFVQPQTDSQYQLQISDVSGKLILTRSNIKGQIAVNEINKTGVYFLSITNLSGKSVHKIIIN